MKPRWTDHALKGTALVIVSFALGIAYASSPPHTEIRLVGDRRTQLRPLQWPDPVRTRCGWPVRRSVDPWILGGTTSGAGASVSGAAQLDALFRRRPPPASGCGRLTGAAPRHIAPPPGGRRPRRTTASSSAAPASTRNDPAAPCVEPQPHGARLQHGARISRRARRRTARSSRSIRHGSRTTRAGGSSTCGCSRTTTSWTRATRRTARGMRSSWQPGRG